jgi:beta-galactosidase beta subunit
MKDTKYLYRSDTLDVDIIDDEWVVFYKDDIYRYIMEIGIFKNVIKMFLYGYLPSLENKDEK